MGASSPQGYASSVGPLCEHTFVQAKVGEQAEARRLRAGGMSVRGIALQVGVAKSSVSVWVRDVPVPIVASQPLAPIESEDPRHKACGKCREELSLSRFNRAGAGHQHWCRECFRVYFRDRGDLHRHQSERAKRARLAPARAVVLERFEEGACVDCGEDEIAVLEFDHIGRKRGHISRMLREGASVDALRAEIDRCEVVCVCCHRRRTARRAAWPRLTGRAPNHWSKARRLKFAHVLEVLAFGGCVDCGERDPVVLDFDHVTDKTDTVARLLTTQASWVRLKIEIAACEVRCANCHRLATHARQGGTWRGASDWLGMEELI